MSQPGRSSPPVKSRYPLYRSLGAPQGRSGRAENLAPPGFDPWTVQPVAQSLYRLSYPARKWWFTAPKFCTNSQSSSPNTLPRNRVLITVFVSAMCCAYLVRWDVFSRTRGATVNGRWSLGFRCRQNIRPFRDFFT